VTIEAGLNTHLLADSNVTDLVGARIYPLKVPQDADLPAIAYQKISGPRDETQSGPSGLVESRMQLTYQGTTYSEAKLVAEAVRGSIDGFSGTMGSVAVNACHLANEIDGWSVMFEKPTVRHDYLIWYQE
jgi:hypothetical protein